MMGNLATILAREDLETSLSATARLAITRAIDHYKTEQFWFTEGRVSFSATSTQAEYTLSASTQAILAVNITKNGSTYEINPISERERLAYDTQNLTGSPTYYAIFADRFIPYPSPNDGYAVEISCTRTPATLSATTDSNVWTTYAEQLIEARAAWWIEQFIFRDYEAASTFALMERNALDALMSRNLEKSANRVTPTQF